MNSDDERAAGLRLCNRQWSVYTSPEVRQHLPNIMLLYLCHVSLHAGQLCSCQLGMSTL